MAQVFRLQRFLDAQEPVYANVVAELGAATKRSHWMWFIFPQITGLGTSPTAVFYAISSLDEARAYAAHVLLGARLQECAELMLAAEGRSAKEILGGIDAIKFRSSMTLFEAADPKIPIFGACLDKYYGGERDAATMAQLRTL